jgi:hypothetical protein
MEPQSTKLQQHPTQALEQAPPQEKGAIGIALLVWIFGGGLGLALLVFVLLKLF